MSVEKWQLGGRGTLDLGPIEVHFQSCFERSNDVADNLARKEFLLIKEKGFYFVFVDVSFLLTV